MMPLPLVSAMGCHFGVDNDAVVVRSTDVSITRCVAVDEALGEYLEQRPAGLSSPAEVPIEHISVAIDIDRGTRRRGAAVGVVQVIEVASLPCRPNQVR